ncbi:MAG TPA: hypothetical protein VG713_22755 [Pirellulales bacterium]|nr:hypothetical protein [Pirellulales bacterium]
MLDAVIRVRAASRLHFGMFSFGQPGVRRFGGVGVMVEHPELSLTVEAADESSAQGPLADRALAVVQQLDRFNWCNQPARCRIVIDHAPPAHAGLGSGTQLALGIAAALNALSGAQHSLDEAVLATGRARRSAIGTHGFAAGGLIVDPGKLEDDEIPPPLVQTAIADEWRFVLLVPTGASGVSGAAEAAAFDRLPAVPLADTAKLCQLATLGMAPAAMTGDFQAFAAALTEFGRLAGKCFAGEQGGQHAASASLPLLELCQRLEVRGAAQSSWGPTVAAVLPDPAAATQFAARVRAELGESNVQVIVTAVANHGASVEIDDSASDG